MELSALRQKITQGFEEQKKLRQAEEDKLVQKFCNFMKELENRHNQEIIKLEKTFKMQCKHLLTQLPYPSPARKPLPASFRSGTDIN